MQKSASSLKYISFLYLGLRKAALKRRIVKSAMK